MWDLNNATDLKKKRGAIINIQIFPKTIPKYFFYIGLHNVMVH